LVQFDSVGNSSFTIPVSISVSQDELIAVRRQDAAGANKNALINFYSNTGSGDTLRNSLGYFNTSGTGIGIRDASGVDQWRMVRGLFPDRSSMRIYNLSAANYLSFRASDTATTQDFVFPAAEGTAGQVLTIDNIQAATGGNERLTNLTWSTPSAGGGTSVAIQDEGSYVTTVGTINFVGAGVSVAVQGTSSVTVTIAGAIFTMTASSSSANSSAETNLVAT
jgi:hypothetical protein